MLSEHTKAGLRKAVAKCLQAGDRETMLHFGAGQMIEWAIEDGKPKCYDSLAADIEANRDEATRYVTGLLGLN